MRQCLAISLLLGCFYIAGYILLFVIGNSIIDLVKFIKGGIHGGRKKRR